ncbi:MAG: PilW family protein [Wenzhouxiangella sp.]
MKKPYETAQKLRAFTLVELMVAMVLGLVIIAAVIQFFSGSRQTYITTEALARAQENGRFAIESMKPPIRSVGLGGICGGAPRIKNHLNTGTSSALDLLLANRAVQGWEYTGTGVNRPVLLANADAASASSTDWVSSGGVAGIPAELANEVSEGRVMPFSDVLMLREPRPVRGIVAGDNNAVNQASLNISYLPGADLVRQCEIILVTNCNRADLFQVTNATSATLTKGSAGGCSPGNLTGGPALTNWSTAHRGASQFYRVESMIFYVGLRSPNDPGADDIPVLYRMSFVEGQDPIREEIVEGIENMQVLYGYSEPGQPEGSGDGQSVNVWLTADNVPNWEYVIAVRIGLLSRSPNPAGAGAASQTFDVALTNVTSPADQFLRQPYNTTIALRNRQIVR